MVEFQAVRNGTDKVLPQNPMCLVVLPVGSEHTAAEMIAISGPLPTIPRSVNT
jgi:hypothetical protein